MIEAASTDVAYAISTIFLFNIAAVLAFPLLGHALGMSQQSFGLFAGTAVNDTSSVVATATTYGAAATSHAVVVKLVRTLMIIPICLGLAALTARKQRTAAAAGGAPASTAGGGQPVRAGRASARRPAATAAPPGRMSPARVVKLVPWFLIGFVVVAAVNSAGVIPAGAHAPLQHVSVFLVAVALSAIGLSTNVAALRKAGHSRCCSAPCCGSPSPPPASASRHSPAPCNRARPAVTSRSGCPVCRNRPMTCCASARRDRQLGLARPGQASLPEGCAAIGG